MSMRVRLSWLQTHDVLEALYQAHLCDICEYDENMEVIPGTECEIQMLIKKFERIKNGAASEQGRRGGVIARRNRILGDLYTDSVVSMLKGATGLDPPDKTHL